MTRRRVTSICAGIVVIAIIALAASAPREIRFDTDEGTWTSVDESPDGRTIIFDLLGRIYAVESTGGSARQLTIGPAFDAQPRFSPDGMAIVFVSDRSGGSNLWLMEPDGSRQRPLTTDDSAEFISPSWSFDGRSIFVSYSSVSRNGAFAQPVPYRVDAESGQLESVRCQITGAKGLGPVQSRDGTWLYFSAGTAQKGFQLMRCNLATGAMTSVVEAPGGASRPAISPDGRLLLYGTREGKETVLKIKDLASGGDRPLAHGLSHDDREAFQSLDLLPSSAFSEDGKFVFTSLNGHLNRVDVETGQTALIPFNATIERSLQPLARFEYAMDGPADCVRSIRNVRISPDVGRAAFSALDRIYVMDLPRGSPARLTHDKIIEASPVWSPDSKYVAFVTWSSEGGSIRRKDPTRSNDAPEVLSSDGAFYDRLAYSPDGKKLVATRTPAAARLAIGGQQDVPGGADLVWLPATGGAPTSFAHVKSVTRLGWPHFVGDDSTRVIYYEPSGGRPGALELARLATAPLSGGPVHTLLTLSGMAEHNGIEGDTDVQLAASGKFAVIADHYKLYLYRMPLDGGVPQLDLLNIQGTSRLSIASSLGGYWPAWLGGGRRFSYSLGHSIFTYDVDEAFGGDQERRSTPRPRYHPVRVDAYVSVPHVRTAGTLALIHGRLITMRGHETIPDGDLLVTGRRIAAIGPHGKVRIPQGTTAIDVRGATVLPGWVDTHFHAIPARGVHSPEVWEYETTLAYGVTTNHDPAAHTTDLYTYMDRLAMGDMIGSRLLTTGQSITDLSLFQEPAEARDWARRHSEFDGTETLKRHTSGRRDQEQWIADAARDYGLTVVVHQAEGTLRQVVPIIQEGNSGLEHTIYTFPLFRDAVHLLARSGITYTPTFQVTFDSARRFGEWYFLREIDISAEARLKRFAPPEFIKYVQGNHDAAEAMAKSGAQSMIADLSAQAAKIIADGGRVAIGSHGQIPGLGFHLELWALASGGTPLYDVLRAGTIVGAEALGHGRDLGSLEVGKIADLQVLRGDPLKDIHEAKNTEYVMKDGRLYDAATLAEVRSTRH